MQTYLIVSSNDSYIQNQCEKLITLYSIDKVNIHAVDPETSVGISDVTNLIHLTKLKPYGGGGSLLFIKNAHKATLEASNALLKILEEPPQNTCIVLTSPSRSLILETIVSRCQIIQEPFSTDNDKTIDSMTEKITMILKLGKGDRILYVMNTLTTREQSLSFLEESISYLSKTLLLPDPPLERLVLADTLKKAVSARRYILHNINFKATMDIFFLGLVKI